MVESHIVPNARPNQYTLGNQTNSTGFFEGLSGGNYSVEVIDNNMCTSTISFDIFEPSSISVSVVQTQNVNCFGENNGSVNLQANGEGTAPHIAMDLRLAIERALSGDLQPRKRRPVPFAVLGGL